jgi:DNA polymerase elongation subunit (family B)
MSLLHIFDAIARDQKVVSTNGEEMEVEFDDADVSDDEYIGQKRKKTSSLQNKEMIINLFGATKEGTPVRVEVNGFQPFFYVEIPNEESKWKVKIEEVVKAKFGKQVDKISFQLVYKKKLFGYTGGKSFAFLKITVPSISCFYEMRKFFSAEYELKKNKLPPLKLYESNIDPMLRFFHIRNLQPCGWIRLEKPIMDEDDPLLTKIYVDWQDVFPGEAPVGFVTAPFHHAFWDIECYSHDGEFPLAKQGYRRIVRQLWNLAKTPEEVPQLLQEAFVDESKARLKLPPLKHVNLRPTAKDVKGATSTSAFTKTIEELWSSRDTIDGKEREERFDRLAKLLDNTFKRIAPLSGDPIIQIGTVTWKNGSNTSEKHVFVLGGSDDIPGVTVHHAKTEGELILKWFDWVIQQNFDVFVGYNIFGFDEKYVWHRLEELGLEQEEVVQRMTRLFDEGGAMELEEKFLSSSALGDNMLYMWKTPGRLRIDLLGHVKRKSAMTSYKLDAVAAAFLSGKLSTIRHNGNDSWLLVTKQKGDARVGRYVEVLDEIGDNLTEKMIITEVTGEGIVVTSEEDLSIIMNEAARWAVVKDDVSPREIFQLHRGSNADRAKVAAYCVQDCDLTLELYKKLEVFNEAMSMANVCSVPVSYIFTRGQGIKIESLIFKDCMVADQLIEVLPSTYGDGNKEGGEDSYEGAIVLDPVPGFYTEAPVGVCDFASLYPSTIISENISHDMLVWVKDYDNNGKFVCMKYGSVQAELFAPPGTQFTDIEFDIWRPDPEDKRKNPVKLKAGIRVCRYAQPKENVKGSLPTIVGKLLAARKAKRNEMAKTDDPFKKALLDAEQNAYKVTANSLYGQLGSPTFKIRLQHLAASVTSYGRKQIMFAKEAIETFYGKEARLPDCCAETVYGDTDSIFVCFNPKDPLTGKRLEGREAIVKTIELTEEAGKFVTGALKAPHDFEYDKVFSPFIIFSKKRYVGNKYEDNPDEFKETSMGIVLKRRDNAPMVKMSYGAAIDCLLNRKDIPGAVQCVKEQVKNLVEGKMKLSQLTITKSLRAEYNTVSLPAHKMLADRIAVRDPGNAPASGERIGFVYIKPSTGQQASKLQGDRIETPQFIEEKGLKPDVEYYIEHQLYNPLTQLFGLMVEQIPGYQPRHWSDDPDKRTAQREALAGDLLFRDAYAMCKKSATRDFMSMFGPLNTALPSSSSSISGPKQVVKLSTPMTLKTVSKQTTLTSFMKDTAIIEDQRLAREMRTAKRAVQKSKEEKLSNK